jgi:hypothetical protein
MIGACVGFEFFNSCFALGGFSFLAAGRLRRLRRNCRF